MRGFFPATHRAYLAERCFAIGVCMHVKTKDGITFSQAEKIVKEHANFALEVILPISNEKNDRYVRLRVHELQQRIT